MPKNIERKLDHIYRLANRRLRPKSLQHTFTDTAQLTERANGRGKVARSASMILQLPLFTMKGGVRGRIEKRRRSGASRCLPSSFVWSPRRRQLFEAL